MQLQYVIHNTNKFVINLKGDDMSRLHSQLVSTVLSGVCDGWIKISSMLS